MAERKQKSADLTEVVAEIVDTWPKAKAIKLVRRLSKSFSGLSGSPLLVVTSWKMLEELKMGIVGSSLEDNVKIETLSPMYTENLTYRLTLPTYKSIKWDDGDRWDGKAATCSCSGRENPLWMGWGKWSRCLSQYHSGGGPSRDENSALAVICGRELIEETFSAKPDILFRYLQMMDTLGLQPSNTLKASEFKRRFGNLDKDNPRIKEHLEMALACGLHKGDYRVEVSPGVVVEPREYIEDLQTRKK
jgi:hypothetical protein